MQQFQHLYITQSLPFDTSTLLGDGAVYRALGIYTPPRGGASLYVVACRTGIGLWRAGDMGGVSLLLDLWPDYDHWRAIYPKGKSKIDTGRARAAIMRECVEAGPYIPPPELLAGGAPVQSTAGKEKAGD